MMYFGTIALVGIGMLAVLAVAGRTGRTLRTVPISHRPPVASAVDLARERLAAGDITPLEFVELREILGE